MSFRRGSSPTSSHILPVISASVPLPSEPHEALLECPRNCTRCTVTLRNATAHRRFLLSVGSFQGRNEYMRESTCTQLYQRFIEMFRYEPRQYAWGQSEHAKPLRLVRATSRMCVPSVFARARGGYGHSREAERVEVTDGLALENLKPEGAHPVHARHSCGCGHVSYSIPPYAWPFERS